MIRLALSLLLLLPLSARAGDTLAVFTAKWCGPCQAYKQTLKGYQGPPRLMFVDIDQRPDLKERFAIKVVPTTVWWINQREFRRETGQLPLQKVRSISHAALQAVKSSARSVLKATGKITKKAAAVVAGSVQNKPGHALVLPPHLN